MSKSYKPPVEPEITGLEEESIANTQEATPVPILAGERRVSVVWISRVYNQFTKEAPEERPAKK